MQRQLDTEEENFTFAEMRKRFNEQAKIEEEQKQARTTAPAKKMPLKKEHTEADIINSCSQQSAIAEELRMLQENKRRERYQRTAANTTTDSIDTSKQAIAELSTLKTASVSVLRSKISAHLSFTAPPASHERAEIETLKLTREGSVKKITEELSIFFNKSKQVISTLKENESAKQAAEELTLPAELKKFAEQQQLSEDKLTKQMQKDIEFYASSTRNIKFERFLELSFVYRCYQVCLERDALRKIAVRVHNIKLLEGDNLSLLGKPGKLSVQSLNYYQDFYKNLPDIEKIWPDAGKQLRQAEIKIIYAHATYLKIDVLTKIANNTLAAGQDPLNDAFLEYLKSNRNLQNYIANGNGLDMPNHPWKAYGMTRLSQPNSSINFNQYAGDKTHVQAVAKVESRIDNDKKCLGFSLGLR